MSEKDADRDAWLREALRHAPDASAAPPTPLSEAILAQARAATASGRRAGASKLLSDRLFALWDALARPPVAAAFATVMVATIVGLLWWDRPLDETMPRPPASVAADRPRDEERRSGIDKSAESVWAQPGADPHTPADARASVPPRSGTEAPASADAQAPMQPTDKGALSSATAPSAGATATARNDARQRGATSPAERSDALPQRRAEPSLDASDRLDEALRAKSRNDRSPDASSRGDDRSAADGAGGPAPFPVARSGQRAAAREPTADNARAPSGSASPSRATTAPPSVHAEPTSPLGAGADETRGRELRREDNADAFAAPRVRPPGGEQRATTTQPSSPLAAPREPPSTTERAKAPQPSSPFAAPLAPPPTAEQKATASQPPPPFAASRAAPPIGGSGAGTEPPPAPLAALFGSLARDGARWSRQTAASGETVALDAAWRNWLAALDVAAGDRWGPATDGSAAHDGAGEVLRLFHDGSLAAVVRLGRESATVTVRRGDSFQRRQAPLTRAETDRLRARLPD